MKLSNIYNALQYCSPKLPILLVGSPGIGKTDIIAKYAHDNKLELIIEHPVIADPTDYKGLPVVTGQNRDKAQWLPIGALAKITSKDCPPTMVLADDLGQAPASVQAAYMQLFLARRLGDQSISDNVMFVAATNRSEDRSGVRNLLSALINRVLILNVESDAVDWANWALVQQDVHSFFPAYARFRQDLFVTVPPSGLVAFCTPRSFTSAGRLYKRGVEDFQIMSGLVGEGIAADFKAFSAVAAKLPNIQQILAKPQSWKIPDDPGMLHAVTCLAARESEANSEGIFRLAEYLGEEWGTALISDSVGVFAGLKTTKIFAQWAKSHKEILL